MVSICLFFFTYTCCNFSSWLTPGAQLHISLEFQLNHSWLDFSARSPAQENITGDTGSPMWLQWEARHKTTPSSWSPLQFTVMRPDIRAERDQNTVQGPGAAHDQIPPSSLGLTWTLLGRTQNMHHREENESTAQEGSHQPPLIWMMV